MRIGILTCSAATQDSGCSSVSCLHDLRKRKRAFERYSRDQNLDLIGIINYAGCPTLAGPEKLLSRNRSLAEFRVDAILGNPEHLKKRERDKMQLATLGG